MKKSTSTKKAEKSTAKPIKNERLAELLSTTPKVKVERVQLGARIEKRLAKVFTFW